MITCEAKNIQFCLFSPRDFGAHRHTFSQIPACVFVVVCFSVSFSAELVIIQSATNVAVKKLRTLTLEFGLNGFEWFPWLFF